MKDLEIPYTFELVTLKYPEETKGLVSIIINIFNGELYLKEALDSVMGQTFENWEAILVDDCSTDKTSEICKEYVQKDSRFKYIRKECNEGLLLGRKTGLENCQGEFITHLDGDDAYYPQFLEKMFAKIKENDYDFVWCDFEDWSGKRNIYEKRYRGKYCALTENKLENCRKFTDFGTAFVWNKLFKRNIYVKNLFPQIDIIYTDRIMHLQTIYHSKSAGFIQESLHRFRMHSVISISRTLNRVNMESRRIKRVVYSIAFYLLTKRFFDADEAERSFVEGNIFFSSYFVLSKKSIIRHKIEYAENFVPIFRRALKKQKCKTFSEKIKKIILIVACYFPLPFRIFGKMRVKI